MTRPVEIWLEFASTYSYPAAMTVGARAAEAGVPLVWRPFLLGPVFAAQGLADSPFNLNPAKGAYMWRDLERICAAEGLPWRRPAIFPQHTVRAARLALVRAEADWGPAFVRAVFRANFAAGADISEEGVLVRALAEAGADPGPALAAAATPEVKAALRSQTAEAMRRGIFGAPSFTVGAELFWGHDRMAAALDWARRGLTS